MVRAPGQGLSSPPLPVACDPPLVLVCVTQIYGSTLRRPKRDGRCGHPSRRGSLRRSVAVNWLESHRADEDVGIAEVVGARRWHARLWCGAGTERIDRVTCRAVPAVGPDKPGVRVTADQRVVVTLELGTQRVGARSIRI